jgi:Phytanoyl-CoA dioxygenase (PhyH)
MTAPVFRDAASDAGFARDGMLVAPLLDRASVDAMRAVYDAYPEQHATAFSATILSRDLGYRRAVYDALAHLFAPIVASLLDDYRIFMAGFLSKQSDPHGAMPMHQDLTLVAPGPRPALTIWCPLVDVDLANGCVEVVRGSHDTNHQPRAAGTPFAYPELEAALRAHHAEPIAMRAGHALFLHHSVIHCSPPNASGAERPVATAVLAPREAPLVYFHRDEGPPALLEEYAVDEEFYLRHAFGTRPEDAHPVAVRAERVDPLPPGRYEKQ